MVELQQEWRQRRRLRTFRRAAARQRRATFYVRQSLYTFAAKQQASEDHDFASDGGHGKDTSLNGSTASGGPEPHACLSQLESSHSARGGAVNGADDMFAAGPLIPGLDCIDVDSEDDASMDSCTPQDVVRGAVQIDELVEGMWGACSASRGRRLNPINEEVME